MNPGVLKIYILLAAMLLLTSCGSPNMKMTMSDYEEIAESLLEKFSKAMVAEDISLIKKCLTEEEFEAEGKQMEMVFRQLDDIHWKAEQIQVVETGNDEFTIRFSLTSGGRKVKTGQIEGGKTSEIVRIIKEKGKWRIAGG
jgi:hypothetical protein